MSILRYTKMNPFIPEQLPIAEVEYATLVSKMGEANRAIARFAGVLHAIPNPDVLLSPLRTQEAVNSSAIEGTQATLGEVLNFEVSEEEPIERKRHDIQEILNYRHALLYAENALTERPFNLNLMLKLHSMLMNSVRGQGKARGQWRPVQNWIGKKDCDIDGADFVPPPVAEMMSALHEWEKYYHKFEPDPLVQLAVVHAQFEIIHPFMDGNGRIGRIIIPLFLFEKKLLHRPMFYLSAWLEERREMYINKLRPLGKTRGAWNDWISFFLKAITEQSDLNSSKALAVKALYEETKSKCVELTRSQYAVSLVDWMFKRPIFDGTQVKLDGSPSRQAVSNLLARLKENGLLHVSRQGSGQRPSRFVFSRLIDLCETKDASNIKA